MRLFTDGGSRHNPGPAALGVVIEDEKGARLRGLHMAIGVATNNVAEYRALIEGLKAVAELHPDRLEVYLDSQLVVEQINGKYKVKKPELQLLNKTAKDLIAGFPEVVVSYLGREKNKGADALVNMALDEQEARSKKGLISGPQG